METRKSLSIPVVCVAMIAAALIVLQSAVFAQDQPASAGSQPTQMMHNSMGADGAMMRGNMPPNHPMMPPAAGSMNPMGNGMGTAMGHRRGAMGGAMGGMIEGTPAGAPPAAPSSSAGH